MIFSWGNNKIDSKQESMFSDLQHMVLKMLNNHCFICIPNL